MITLSNFSGPLPVPGSGYSTQQPGPPPYRPPLPGPKKSHKIRNVVFAVVGVFMLLVIIGAALGGGNSKSSAAGAAGSARPAPAATTPPSPPSASAPPPTKAQVRHAKVLARRAAKLQREAARANAAAAAKRKAAKARRARLADTVEYVVTGTPGADVTYGPAGSDITGSVPMNVIARLGDPAYYAINAQLQGGGTVSCKILVGGRVISSGTAEGGFNIASCEISQDSFSGSWQDDNSG
jgi:hypothetical protein